MASLRRRHSGGTPVEPIRPGCAVVSDRPLQVGAVEGCPIQLRAAEICPRKVAAAEVSPVQIGAGEVGLLQPGEAEVHVAQMGIAEVGTPEIHPGQVKPPVVAERTGKAAAAILWGLTWNGCASLSAIHAPSVSSRRSS